MSRIVLFTLCLCFGAGLAIAFLPAQAQPQAAPACPERLVGQDSLVCACSAQAAAAGSVWGADLYTDDSAICRAAVHAGTIPASGGVIWVFERPGQESYAAVVRNGVSSSSWPAWRRSIAFRPASEATAATEPRLAACPTNAGGMSVGATLRCACSIDAMTTGSVWGAGPYTGDSAICQAARHAGVIGSYGGPVSLRVLPGRDAYPASVKNGVTAAAWASYPLSFGFEP